MRRTLATGLLAFACFAAAGTTLAADAQVKPGAVPPDNLGWTAKGDHATVSSLHGKIVVVSFWATWCGYCMKELPVLAQLQTLANQRKLPLQVVAVDYREDRSTFRRISRVLRPRFPDMVLSWDEYGEIGKPYGADKGIPVMVMLHRDGTVAHVHAGYDESMLDTLVGEINALLQEPPPPAAAANAP